MSFTVADWLSQFLVVHSADSTCALKERDPTFIVVVTEGGKQPGIYSTTSLNCLLSPSCNSKTHHPGFGWASVQWVHSGSQEL